MKSPKFGLFPRLIAPKPYIRHQNSRSKGNILEMSPSCRDDSHRPQLWCLSCSSITNTLPSPRVPYFGLFLGPGKTQRIIFFTSVCLLFQKWLKSAQDKWPKGRVALITEKNKTRFGTLGGTPRAISPIFLVWVRTVARHLYSRFHPHRFRFGEVITEKPVQEARRKCNIGSSSLFIYLFNMKFVQ